MRRLKVAYNLKTPFVNCTLGTQNLHKNGFGCDLMVGLVGNGNNDFDKTLFIPYTLGKVLSCRSSSK